MDGEESRFQSFLKSRKLLGLPDLETPADVYSDSDEDDDSQADDDDWIQCSKEQCNSMLEIFGIVYLGKDNVEPRNQLGRIYMDTPVGILDIYNVDKVDEETRETIKLGDEFDVADIKSPIPFRNDRDIFGNTIFCNSLYFDLFCGTYKGEGHEIFSETQFISRDEAYSKKLKLDSIDGSGEVVILMGFYAHATIARVDVRLDTSVAANLHGSVAATNTELDELMATSILFLKEQHKGIPIGTDGLIPLSRSCVAVPFESDLYLDIYLVVDGHPLQTIMCLSARKAGVSTKCFENLSVTVNWEALYYHSKKKVNEA